MTPRARGEGTPGRRLAGGPRRPACPLTGSRPPHIRDTALAYIERIEAFCDRLSIASERGHRRDDIRPGLRIVGFERRVTVAFSVEEERVMILRLFYGGRAWEGLLE